MVQKNLVGKGFKEILEDRRVCSYLHLLFCNRYLSLSIATACPFELE